MSAQIEERDREFARSLQAIGPASVSELCARLDVTATSVRQRLARMEAAGLVDREAEKSGRGRPVHRYRLTQAGLRSLGSNYADLAVLLWSELSAIEHQPTRERVFGNLRTRLVERFGGGGAAGSLNARVKSLAAELSDAGLDVAVGSDGHLPVLKGCACPYPDIALSDDSICRLEQEVFAEVLGAEIELRSRCVDGHACCEFAVSEKAG